MAESREEIQLDWVAIDDHRVSARRLLEAAAERIGIPSLAHWLDEDPSTLRNQLAHRERKRPSAELFVLCFLLDGELRQKLAGLCKEVVIPAQTLDPWEALRLIQAKALAGWDRRAASEVSDILSRVVPEEGGNA